MESGTSQSPTDLVGRTRECAVIDHMLEAARRRESGSLVVRGEAGMGKTALLGYAADRAGGMRVLRVTGVEAESDLAFAGLHGLVWPIVDELRNLPEPQRAALQAALGLARGEGPDRFLVSAGVLSLLAEAAEARPILCLVDDAQWLDVPSSDSLVFAARRLAAEGVVIVFGAREGELRRFEAPSLEELTLTRLDRELATVLLGRGGGHAVASVRERLMVAAAGNPLALLELPAGLSEAELAGRAPLPGALPLTARLHAAFMQQVERLPESSRSVLVIAAAEDAGELAVILRAADVLELPQDALDPAVQTGLVQTDGTALTFRHPLIRSAVYESAPIGLRQRVHAALADALGEEQHTDRALWHRAMAARPPDEEVAAALEASAWQSQLRGGHASAASAVERAAALSETGSARGVRLAAAVEAAWSAGQADRARSLVRRSLPLVDRPQRARLLYLSGVIEGQSGWVLDGVNTRQKAVALSEDASLTLEMLRDACGMASYAGHYDETVVLGRRAEELVGTNDTDRFNAAAVTASALELSGDYTRAALLSAEAMELSERLDDPTCLTWAAHTAARVGFLETVCLTPIGPSISPANER